jgi:hypothetical protein
LNGKNKGRRKYVKGHAPSPPLCDPTVRAKASQTRWENIPLGTRRKQESGRGKTYWQIKVGRGRWPLEHRWIIEQELGRKLRTDEHVHHVNGDGLDNRRENLQLLSASEHHKIAGSEMARTGVGMFAHPVCSTCGWRHPPHE